MVLRYMDELTKAIWKFALENAINYDGKANPKALIGKVMGNFPDRREDMPSTMKLINSIVDDVNKLSLDSQKKRLEEISPGLLDKKEKEKEERKGHHSMLRELPNAVKGKVILRFEPSPSGGLHIGHAYSLSLNYLYKKMYDGKLLLRISDTDPSNIDPKAYEILSRNANWLTNEGIDEIIIQSDRMQTYYNHALQLIEDGYSYVCTCPQEMFKEFATNKEECPCRNLDQKEQLNRWSGMFNNYNEGDAVVRAKFSMKDSNPAMRDFPLLRISDAEHVRQGKKYRVWPLMNFAVAIDDYDLGLTHVLRGKDHFDNTKRQKFLFKSLRWEHPEYVHVGKINFKGLKLSTSETRMKIEQGIYSGWDDIRLPFLSALERRGFDPKALLNVARDVGVTLNDKTMDANEFFKSIEHHNTKFIENVSYRYFFISDYVEIIVYGAPSQEIELDLHPDNKKGGRFFSTNTDFLIAKHDFDNIKENEVWRLMDCLNFVKREGKFLFHSLDYETYKNSGKKEGAGIIHWLPSSRNVDVNVRLLDNSIVSGKGEALISGIESGKIIQFERFGFVRKDKKEFWFCHG